MMGGGCPYGGDQVWDMASFTEVQVDGVQVLNPGLVMRSLSLWLEMGRCMERMGFCHSQRFRVNLCGYWILVW